MWYFVGLIQIFQLNISICSETLSPVKIEIIIAVFFSTILNKCGRGKRVRTSF